MTYNVKILNEDGVIRGIGPKTGNKVPVQIVDLATGMFRTESSEVSKYSNPTVAGFKRSCRMNLCTVFIGQICKGVRRRHRREQRESRSILL